MLSLEWLQKYLILALNLPQGSISTLLFNLPLQTFSVVLVTDLVHCFLKGYGWTFDRAVGMPGGEYPASVFKKNNRAFVCWKNATEIFFSFEEVTWMMGKRCQKYFGGTKVKLEQRELILEIINLLENFSFCR